MKDLSLAFGDGRAILLNPDVSHAGLTPRDVQDGNRRWLMRLLAIYEAHDKTRKDGGP